jgi:hypothetical protein
MAEKKILTEEDEALLAELGIEIEVKKNAVYTAREERIIAGFSEIRKFVHENGRLPEHGEDREIFERLFAIRLDQIRNHDDCKTLLGKMDDQGLLIGNYKPILEASDDLDDDELLAQLGVDEREEHSITNLKHVKSRAEKKAAEEIANRTICEDFANFKPLFEEVKKDIELKYRKTIQFKKDAGFTKTTIKTGQFLIIVGQIAYVEEIGETIKAPNGEDDARLRVIYDNGTESNILLRSLIRAMYKDDTSRFITETSSGPLFSGESGEDDLDSGTIYVLRSLSNHPVVKENRDIVHKIGVTGGDVKKRLVNAKFDSTFLMADVEIVATYKLANINRTKLEKIFHKFFASSNLNIEVKDRFGRLIKAQEWFLVPLFIIDEMVEKIKEGTISSYYYDPELVKIKKH